MLRQFKVWANIISSFIFIIMVIVFTTPSSAKNLRAYNFVKSLTGNDTIPVDTTGAPLGFDDTTAKKLNRQIVKPGIDTLPPAKPDSVRTKADSVRRGPFVRKDTTAPEGAYMKVDTLLISKDSLDAPVSYKAADSGVLIIASKQFILYGKANTTYGDMKLDANTIKYDQATNYITAYGGVDTSDNPLNKPKFVQGDAESIIDTIFYNMKTQKGITKNTYYKEGELFVNAQRVKKVNTNTAYALNGRFTTCNLDTPHFDIRARRMEMITNKIAVSGLAYPEFEGVPIPIGIPFGIYPLQRGRHSGLLPPQFTSNQSFGLGLEGLGFYKVINDNADVTVRGDIYSYGGWRLNVIPNYYKRYKYRGTLTFSVQHTKTLNSSGYSSALLKDEFSVSNTYNIQWSHTSDTKARPGTSFSASVNAGSTQFNKNTPYNALINYQNQLNSSITYNKVWKQGKYNLNVSANHNQNNLTRLVNLNIPTVSFTAATVYPFQKEDQVGSKKWYQNLGIAYNGSLLNQISFYDSVIDFKRLLDTAQWGVDHRIPITLSLPAVGPLIFAPSVSYEERWYAQRNTFTWNPERGKVDTVQKRGLIAAREMTFGISLNTRIFGTVNFKKSNGIQAIRHEVKPFISLSYKPNLVGQFYQDVKTSAFGDTFHYSQLQNGVIGAFSDEKFGGLSFGIDNLFEMKVKNRGDSTGKDSVKKVKLLDGLSITSAYNFLADTCQWSPLAISMRSTFFNKVNLTGSATIDQYKSDYLGRRTKQLLWKEGKLGRLSSGNLALSTQLQSKKAEKAQQEENNYPADETLTPDEQQQELDYVRSNPGEFADFNIPWSVQISYALTLTNQISPDVRRYETQVGSNISINGDLNISPKWKIGGGTYFNSREGKLGAVNMFLTREMHCWQMVISVQVGQYKSFSIVLNPKSGILRDLRINKRFLQQ